LESNVKILKLLRSPTAINIGLTVLMMAIEYVVERRRERQSA
jgi:hypothetical protein